jgi:hypothetical protein
MAHAPSTAARRGSCRGVRLARALLLAIGAVCALAAGAAPAAPAAPTAEDPFVVLAPVADRTPAARARALREAVATGLGRASGLERGPDDWAEALAAPRLFVLREGYDQLDPVAARLGGEPEADLLLRVVLDESAVERHLRERGLPFWGRERPELLLWLMATDPGRPEGPRRIAAPSLLEGEPDAPVAAFAAAALRRARERGQPVLLPVLDLEERRRIRPLALWSGFLDDAELTARSYAVDGLLWARLVEATPGYEVSWRLRTGGLDETLVFDCASPERCGARVADALVNRLASRLAVRTGAPVERLYAQIAGVTAFDALQRVRAAFSDLGLVRTTLLRELKADSVLLELEVQGSAAQLVDALALVDALELEPPGRPGPGPVVLRGRFRDEGAPGAPGGTAVGNGTDPADDGDAFRAGEPLPDGPGPDGPGAVPPSP